MACVEGERLKSEVLTKIEEYLQAEEAQQQSVERFGDSSLSTAESAYESLAEARRQYWEHIQQHQCEADSSLPPKTDTLTRVAV